MFRNNFLLIFFLLTRVAFCQNLPPKHYTISDSLSYYDKDLPKKLKDVTILYISTNSIPSDFNPPESIIVLIITNYTIKNLPASFGKMFHNLKYLEINDCNEMEYLPESLCELDSLVSITIENGSWPVGVGKKGLKKFPDNIGKLKKIEIIHIYNTSLSELPPSFSQLTKIQSLNIENAPIKEFPKPLCELKTTSEYLSIHLDASLFQNIPEEIGNIRCGKLTPENGEFGIIIELLNSNKITSLPTGIIHSRNLALHINATSLKNISSVNNLQAPFYLGLSGNIKTNKLIGTLNNGANLFLGIAIVNPKIISRRLKKLSKLASLEIYYVGIEDSNPRKVKRIKKKVEELKKNLPNTKISL